MEETCSYNAWPKWYVALQPKNNSINKQKRRITAAIEKQTKTKKTLGTQSARLSSALDKKTFLNESLLFRVASKQMIWQQLIFCTTAHLPQEIQCQEQHQKHSAEIRGKIWEKRKCSAQFCNCWQSITCICCGEVHSWLIENLQCIWHQQSKEVDFASCYAYGGL